MNLTTRPIGMWPKAFTKDRKLSAFRSSYNDTVKLLGRELEHLNAKSPCIRIALLDSQIRQDGLPYVKAKVQHPGVIVEYVSKGRQVSMPCDVFTFWEDNLRAIALTLQRLREAARYGVLQGEQYAGFVLEEPRPLTEIEAAAQSIPIKANVSNVGRGILKMVDSVDYSESIYRRAVSNTHPDIGGDHEAMLSLNNDMDIIRKYHKNKGKS